MTPVSFELLLLWPGSAQTTNPICGNRASQPCSERGPLRGRVLPTETQSFSEVLVSDPPRNLDVG
jgi:hypothetical protein